MPGRDRACLGRGRMRTLLSLLSATALLAALAGCGTLGGPAAPEDAGGTSASTQLEQSSIKVGVLPIVNVCALQRAQSAGYFQQEGLTVDLVTIQGGAVALPQLVRGELDMTFTNWVSLFQAQVQGMGDFKLISPGYDAGQNTFVIMTKPDSPIRTPQDLDGKRISVNTFGNIAELTARSALQTNGVDANQVQFVSIPYPDMIAALQRDQIDAALLNEPFITQAAMTLGAVAVLDTASGPTANMPLAGVGVTATFAKENPNTVRAFQRAVDRAQAEMANRSVVEQTLPTYSKIDSRTAALLNLGSWPTSFSETRLQRVADLMREFGLLNQPLDIEPMIMRSDR